MKKQKNIEIISYFEKKLSEARIDFAKLLKEINLEYRGMEVARLCNYILSNKTESDLINQTLRLISKNKYRENFDNLLDFIVTVNDVNLKVSAIKAVVSYKNKKAVPTLLNCLNDKNSNYKVRFVSADALGKIGDKNAFDALGYVVCDEEEKSAYVKESAVVALGNLGDKRAIDVFSSIMSSKQIFLNKFSYLKERIVEAISKLDVANNNKAMDILKRSLLDSSPQIRISAIETVMNIESSESYDLIYDRLKYDDDIEVKKNALVALYNISDRAILDEVIKGDYSDELKESARDIINEYEEDNEE